MLQQRFKSIMAGLLTMLSLAMPAHAGEWEIGGYAGFETRTFLQDSRFAKQEDSMETSITVQPELFYRSDDGAHQFALKAYYRLDSQDNERSHGDLREAYWRWVSDEWEVLVGLNKVFWGVTESRHLVDIINQTDLVEANPPKAS